MRQVINTQLFLRIHSASFHSITRAVWVPFCVEEVSAALLWYYTFTWQPNEDVHVS